MMHTLDATVVRRFVLGRQGLWPGRRWAGAEAVPAALKAVEAMQLDPLTVVARSHDLALWGRVLDYRPEHLREALYTHRAGFDYGGGLFVYPMEELPYWRLPMRRRHAEGRWAAFAAENPGVIDAVRSALRERGPLGNRDLEGTARVSSYRGRKDTALALYYLWITGEVMIHHRRGFDRVYAFREQVAPAELDYEAREPEAEAYFARKTVAFHGMVRPSGWRAALAYYLQRPISPAEARAWLERLIAEGLLAPVRVEGSRETFYVLRDDLSHLAALAAGEVPESWRPLETTTAEEAVFLAPLEIVSARGRAGKLFDFEYVWEVYKPEAARRWGYYTLPVLYGDRLVARFDARLDRKARALRLPGFWLEPHAPAEELAFAEALGRGLARFAGFLEAECVDLSRVSPPVLRDRVDGVLREHGLRSAAAG